MKLVCISLCLFHSVTWAQLTMEVAQERTVRRYHIGSYSYHEQFKGHPGYGAPLILTADGGAAAFGDGDEGIMLVKLNREGTEQWKTIIPPKGDEVESQSVVEDEAGNFCVFILVYDHSKYRGGCERAVYLDKNGGILRDTFIGSCDLMNNPIVSYIRALDDGRIALRGHVVTEKPAAGEDPIYRFWEGWLDSTGKLTEQVTGVIDWSKQEEWQGRLRPE